MTEDPLPDLAPSRYSLVILRAINLLPTMYAGTVGYAEKRRRRAANRTARRSRAINRKVHRG